MPNVKMLKFNFSFLPFTARHSRAFFVKTGKALIRFDSF